MADESAGMVISTILKHDAKITSYKIALLRAINDVVLSFPDLRSYRQDIAIPLRLLAEFWVAYYWGFAQINQPIWQGQRAATFKEVTPSNSKRKNDMAFRPALTRFRELWEHFLGSVARPSDGFFVINELRVPRKRKTYPPTLLDAYQQVLKDISKTLEMPIQYAGPGNWTVFEKPKQFKELNDHAIAVPSTQSHEKCLVVKADLWQVFREMSLWVEALCIHEWCLFTESVKQDDASLDRGHIYKLLTDRPDNRRPLTWERNKIDLLILEGNTFICPWTQREITQGIAYDLDHLLPVSVYPINELWNLVPADPKFNSHVKRDRLPTIERLQQAQPYFEFAYNRYNASKFLSQVLQEDAAIRFSRLRQDLFAASLAHAVVDFIEQVAETRNLTRFG
jgi:hypothetical protein